MLSKRRSGLGSLIPGADLPTADDGLSFMAPISAVAVNPYQPRHDFDPEALEQLTDSIRQYGVLQPLLVRSREQGYELIAGERRLTAARHAGCTEVPVIVREATNEEMLALALIENLQRADLNAMEEAHAYRMLAETFDLSHAEVARRVGKSRTAVVNTLRLLALPSAMQQAITNGTISEGHGRALLMVDEPQYRDTLFQQAVSEHLSVREVETRAQRKPPVHKTPPRSVATSGAAVDAEFVQLLDELQHRYGTKVTLRPGSTASSGAIELEYYSASDLIRLCELLSGR